jgi:hypothetical protein
MNSYPLMSIGAEDVQEYGKQLGYMINAELADNIAELLATTWESDYDYETFMEEGVSMEIQHILEENPNTKGIRKITEVEDHSIANAMKLWNEFQKIPMDIEPYDVPEHEPVNMEKLSKDFLHFEVGTNKWEVVEWFENTFDDFNYEKAKGGKI